MSLKKLACLMIFAAALPALARTQAPAPAAPAKPDSPEVKALIEKAKQTGGAMWAGEAHFFCEAPRANSATDPVIVPTKIFDNVYAIGNSGTTVYVIQTSDGLLMIDSLGAAQVDTLLLPGFQKLGLDPAQVKIIIAGHGHADHVGGSRYMQERFGSKVYISAADWNLIENPPPARGGGAPAAPQVWPKRDQVLTEGQPVVLGDLKVMPVAIPGHTPGSMGFIFPVKDNGRTHMAASVRRNGPDPGNHFRRRPGNLLEVGRALQGRDDEGQGRRRDPEPSVDGSDPGEAGQAGRAQSRAIRIRSSSARRTIRSSST